MIMKLSGNTVLITGGTSGIGFELAARFQAKGNTVIVTGRDPAGLARAQAALPGLHTVRSDVADPAAVIALHREVTQAFPDLNMLINNAGIMRKINLQAGTADLEEMTREIDINLSGCIRMVMQFLPHLMARRSAAIVNVTSGLAFVPFPISPVYSAAKAGLHSFTQSLRVQLKHTGVKVFELAPPATETPLFRGDFSADDLRFVTPMPLETLGRHAMAGLERDVLEIRPGLSNMLKLMSRIAPGFILAQLAKPAEHMLAPKSGI
jgi:uncharacterized oxidoreductase